MQLFYQFLLGFLLSIFFYKKYDVLKKNHADILYAPPALAYFTLAYFIFVCVLYVLAPGYREHIEPTVTIISLMSAEGLPVYPEMDSVARYHLVYGPTSYLFQGVFLKLFNDPVLGSKIYGGLCALLATFVIFGLIKKKYGNKYALNGIFYFLVILLIFAQTGFRNQSDSIILLGNSLAVSSVLMANPVLSVIILSAGSALSINAKFHSAGYILPIIVWYYRKHGVIPIIIAFVLTLIFVALPFLLKNYSIENYLAIIKTFSHHRFSTELFIINLSTAFVILIPILLIVYLWLKNTHDRQDRIDLFATMSLLLLMILAVAVVASKEGAGSYHLLPFAPVIAALFAKYQYHFAQLKVSVFKTTGIRNNIFYALVFGWVIGMFLYTFSIQKHYFRYIAHAFAEKGIEQEIIKIRDKYAGSGLRVTVGYTDRKGYDYTFFKPQLWHITKDYLLEVPALMDLQHAGINVPDQTIQRYSQQYYDIVILPNSGKPFSLTTWYAPYSPLFGEKLPEVFIQNYTLKESYKYWSIWQANRQKAQ